MKKFLNLILNGVGAVLAIVALFLGFAPVAASVTTSGLGSSTTINADDSNSLFKMFTEDGGSKFVGVGVVIIIFLVIAILAIGLLIAAEFLKKSCKWEWIINIGVCVLMVIAGILYFAIPEITKEKLKMDYNYLDNYYYLLKYKLISEIDTLDKYLDVVEGIDIRIKKFILVSNTYQELIDNIKTKRFTYNKLNRMFLHILFNIKKDQKYDINYIRVLGFNLKGRLYLKTIKDDLDTLIITNYKDIDDEVLKIERRITILYLQIIKREDLIKEELKSIPIKIN